MSPTRRQALKSLSSILGCLAANCLSSQRITAAQPVATHFPARAKRVIFLCMKGGPSHVDLFDDKPMLAKYHGKSSPIAEGLPKAARLLGPVAKFRQHGQSGQRISDLLPNLAKHADDLCFINSMHTDLPNHSQAFVQMHTGSFQFTRPSVGAWTLFGLGSENEDLPGFITLSPPADNGGAKNYGNAFLPASYQATKIGSQQIPEFYAKLLGVDEEPGPPLRNVTNLFHSEQQQRQQLQLIRDLNRIKLAREVHHPEVEGVISGLQLAFRMQAELPSVLDLRRESERTLADYGIGAGLPSDRFGRQCLLARRLIEAGVRFVELTSPVGWDHHFRLQEELQKSCQATDLPVSALLRDLKQRGMLDETLVIWAGEFGRTPYSQAGSGRDHNHRGYTIWMAGGGVRGGMRYGATDEFGYQAVHRPVHIHDWHATILHLLGLDHQRLTFHYAGRSFRLTDVSGEVIDAILA